MAIFQKFDETRSMSGVGCALYYKNNTGKYSILIPVETVPSIAGTPESIEFDITTSDTKGKVPGKITLDEKEVDVINHRDNMRRIKSLEGKNIEFLKVMPDYSAEKFTGKVYYSSQDVESGGIAKATLKIVPASFDGNIDNCYDLLQPTCHFLTAIDTVVEVDATSKTPVTISVTTDPGDAEVTATSGTPGVATVTFSSGELKITPVAKGSTLVTLELSKEGYAPWTTTVLVIAQ